MKQLALGGLLAASAVWLSAQTTGPRSAVPVDAISGIVEAFRSNSVVALSDAHGNRQAQDFLISLVRDRRFTDVVNDVVVEFGSARYQSVMDQFVNGEDVPYDVLRRVWRDTTQASASLDLPIYEEFYRAVRALNATLPKDRRLRVLLGDPPIVWEQVKNQADHRKWIEMREWYPAALIEVEVLAKQRRALVVYGHGHFQRRHVMSNYDMSDRRAHTLISILEQSSGTRAFIVWRDAGVADLQPAAATWKTPALALVAGTTLGAVDFGRYFNQGDTRFAIRDGKLIPIPRSEWRQVPAHEQLDAVLYLGPPSSIVMSTWTRELCADAEYMNMRLGRIALAGIPPSAANELKTHCAEILKQ